MLDNLKKVIEENYGLNKQPKPGMDKQEIGEGNTLGNSKKATQDNTDRPNNQSHKWIFRR
jgi:hypothetical protein